MTAADLEPIIALLGTQLNFLVFLVVILSGVFLISCIRLCIVIYRSVKGRMNHVR